MAVPAPPPAPGLLATHRTRLLLALFDSVVWDRASAYSPPTTTVAPSSPAPRTASGFDNVPASAAATPPSAPTRIALRDRGTTADLDESTCPAMAPSLSHATKTERLRLGPRRNAAWRAIVRPKLVRQDRKTLALEVLSVPGHDGCTQNGGHAADQRVGQRLAPTRDVAPTPRLRGPPRHLRRTGDVVKRVEQRSQQPALLVVAKRQRLAGHDIAGEQLVALLEEPLEERRSLRIAICVVDQQRRVEQITHPSVGLLGPQAPNPA